MTAVYIIHQLLFFSLMLLCMDSSVLVQTLLAQPVIVIVSARVVLVKQHPFTSVAHIQEGIGYLVKHELQHKRCGQNRLAESVELEEVALAESQELVTFVQKGIGDEWVLVAERR